MLHVYASPWTLFDRPRNACRFGAVVGYMDTQIIMVARRPGDDALPGLRYQQAELVWYGRQGPGSYS